MAVPILLEGERGVGKKQLAHALHEQSSRRDAPFVVLECAGKSADMLARELVGSLEPSRLESAAGDATAKMVAAHGGTLYVEDVDQLPVELQRSLVQALASGEESSMDSSDASSGKFRLICSSARELAAQVEQGAIAVELARAVGQAVVVVPPLRTRGQELALLADHFARESARELGVADKSFAPAVMAAFSRYSWPGNLHELRDVVRAAVSSSAEVIELENLPAHLLAGANDEAAASAPSAIQGLELAEYRAIRDCLRSTRGNLTRAARELRIARSTLYAKLKKYGLEDGVGGLRIGREQGLMMHA